MTEKSERAAARDERLRRFARSVQMRPEHPLHSRVVSHFDKRRATDPAFQRRVEASAARANLLANALRLNGPNLAADQYLRNFLVEYNNRIFQGEGVNQPTSFNVVRAFTEPDETSFVLKLLPEKFCLLSFDYLLDKLTEPKGNHGWDEIVKDLDELTIYEYNIRGEFAPFDVSGVEDLVFAGVAFVRDGEELSLVAVLGMRIAEKITEKLPFDKAAISAGKEFLMRGKKEIDYSDIGLLGDDRYRPLVLMTRINLSNGTSQVRYVLEERADVFDAASDDPDVILTLLQHPEYEKYRDAALEKVKKFGPCFDVISQIPKVVWKFETEVDHIRIERHPTAIKSAAPGALLNKMKRTLKPSEMRNYVEVEVITTPPAKETFEISASGLKIERHGYWKALALNEEGRDQNGQVVYGKTWVIHESSWYAMAISEPGVEPIHVKIGSGEGVVEGYVYVLRSALHPRDVYKIGFTTLEPDERARQLSGSSGQPDMLNVVQEWHVRAPRAVEQEVHRRLDQYRVNSRREFFNLKYPKIRETIEDVIRDMKALLG